MAFRGGGRPEPLQSGLEVLAECTTQGVASAMGAIGLRSAVLMGALVTSWPAVSQNLVGRGLTTPDLSGEWLWQVDEDAGQPPYGDYLGIPFNSAGRLRADTTAESLWGTPEFRCRPHSLPHQWRGIGGARFIKELDPLSRVAVGGFS